VPVEDPRPIREHHDIASTQGLVGQKLRDRIRDFAWRFGLDHGLVLSWLSPDHLRAADTVAALELRKGAVVVGLLSGIVRLWRREKPEQAEKILRSDGRSKKCAATEPGSKRGE